MTVNVERLKRVLRQATAIDEWLLIETHNTFTLREMGRSDRAATQQQHTFEVHVFRDQRTNRGQSSVVLGSEDDALIDERLRAAEQRARLNSGPIWRLPRPAAPARVRVADDRLVSDPQGTIIDVAAALARRQRSAQITAATIAVRSTKRRVVLSTDFDHQYDATEVAVRGTLALTSSGVRSHAEILRTRRRIEDLELDRHLVSEAERLALSSGASELPRQVYDLVISTDALRTGRANSSWLSPLAHQASGKLARRGLSRYQPGQRILRDQGGDSINVFSDGSLDFARESAPMDDWGGPVRRFTLVADGTAASLSLPSREAALRGEAGNGGARNLTLGVGGRSLDDLTDGERPRLVVSDFDAVHINASTGELVAKIGLASSTDSKERLTGGHFAIDLFEALGRIRLSREKALGESAGPAWIAIPDVRVF